jgi:hypothetical protein
LLVHAAAVVLVVGFLALGWWQVSRAAAGNLLSFGYAVEWPVFAAFVVFVWVREVRQALRDPGHGEARAATGGDGPAVAVPPPSRTAPAPMTARRRRNQAAYDDHDDPELAAYNHYLGWLNANPHKNPADYPGVPVNQGETL